MKKILQRLPLLAMCAVLQFSALAFEEDYYIDMTVGETHQIEEKGVDYVSHEPRVASVSKAGEIKAVGFGHTMIEVIGKNGEKQFVEVEAFLPKNAVFTTQEQYRKAVLNGAMALNDTLEFKQRISGLPQNPAAKKQALQKFFTIPQAEVTLPFLKGIEFAYSYYDTQGSVTADVSVKYEYRSSAEVMKAIQDGEEPESPKAIAVYDKVFEIIYELGLNSQTSRDIVARQVHDYLIINAKYDLAAAANENLRPDSYEAYGVMINGQGVCQSYAEAYLLILAALEVPAVYEVGTANNVPHSWNKVLFDDGKWRIIDVTFDDPTPDIPGKAQSDFFDISEKQLRKTHSW